LDIALIFKDLEKMPISDTGFWVDVDFEKEHCFDKSLASSILTFLQTRGIKKMYDFGCGPGQYVQKMREGGIESIGYDGNPITSRFLNCNVADITNPDFTLEPVDCVLCLEVGEHVPNQFERVLFDNIDKHVNPGGILILSWAIPGQGGYGHVNCQTNQYVRSQIIPRGYTSLPDIESTLRNHSSLSWFKHTILVFQKN